MPDMEILLDRIDWEALARLRKRTRDEDARRLIDIIQDEAERCGYPEAWRLRR